MAEGRAGALEDYATVAFSMSGVKQDISLEDWKSGWASIVGGLKGKPTSQQFNMVTYILSALLNQAISDLSTVKGTANSALPKSDFTAKQIVALLAAYGLMEGCDADTIDGKHANAFAPSTHEHSASQITSGNLPIERGGTGSGTAADACKNLGAMRNVGGTFTGTVYFANGTAHYIASTGDAHVKSLGVTEDVTARRVYDAVYNDYAEFMPRGENTEPGDIIALDTSSQTERYIKATNLSNRIAGVHTDEYAMLIGGNKVEEGQDVLARNLPLFIPVSLAGRVHAKVVGPVHKSDVGGVVLNIKSEQHLALEFDRMMQIPDARSIMVQPMLKGTELFIGAKYEEKFGHVVLCGLGGIFVEVLKDVSSGLAPLSYEEAYSMIRSLRAYKIIKGTRGQKGVNEDKFAEIIVRLSTLLRFATEIKEMDINPLLATEKYVIAVDARIRIEKN
mgnify:CR=1 FL=1